MKITLIDIGTNSIKQSIYKIADKVPVLEYYERRSDACLGANKEFIEDETQERVYGILKLAKEKNDELAVDTYRIVGTDILRRAENATEFTKKIEDLFGVPVEIMSHEKEAYYLYRGLRDIVPEGSRFGSINMGGGSTEIVIGNTSELEKDIKIPFGVNYLRETYGDENGVIDWKKSDAYLQQELQLKPEKLDYFFLSGVFDFNYVALREFGFEFDECTLRDHPIQSTMESYREHTLKLREIPLTTLQAHYTKNPRYADNFALGQSVYYTAAVKLGVPFVIPSPYEHPNGLLAEMIEQYERSDQDLYSREKDALSVD